MNRLTLLQRELLIWLALCVAIVFISSFYIEAKGNEYEGILRFHVIANSNSDEDQALKLMVRDRVVGTLETEIAEAAKARGETPTEAFTKKYVENNLGRINEMAAETIEENGFDYKVASKVGVTYIPEKSYDDLTFPAGNYEALNIVIGSGKGENWFCVIYPPLCLINNKGDKGIELKSKIRTLITDNKNEDNEKND